jgi:hypothetical protein
MRDADEIKRAIVTVYALANLQMTNVVLKDGIGPIPPRKFATEVRLKRNLSQVYDNLRNFCDGSTYLPNDSTRRLIRSQSCFPKCLLSYERLEMCHLWNWLQSIQGHPKYFQDAANRKTKGESGFRKPGFIASDQPDIRVQRLLGVLL